MKTDIILANLRRIFRSLNIESKRIEKEHGITIPQILCLETLFTQPEFKATHTLIKSQLQLNGSTVSGILSRLEKKGLIAKLPKMGDKRITYWVLTANGAELVENKPLGLFERVRQSVQAMDEKQAQQMEESIVLLAKLLANTETEVHQLEI